MARSNKPIVWAPFAAGGTLTALLIPALILLTLLAAVGSTPEGLSYDHMHAFAASVTGKFAIFAVIVLSLWSSAHRIRITAYDFGVRRDTLVAAFVYLAAALGTAATLLFLLRI
jgi:fumarate reductase subunit D